jgi:LCP family protein required for cell wall assembly
MLRDWLTESCWWLKDPALKSALGQVGYNTRRILVRLLHRIGESLLFDCLGLVMAQLPRSSSRSKRRQREPIAPPWALGGLVALFIAAAALVGFLVFTSVRDAVAAWQITSPGSGPVFGNDPGSPGGSTGGGNNNGAAPAPLVQQKWQGTQRVTILLLGIDRRKIETERAYRTDSMMVLSVDPVAKTAAILSIPRDLWVDIPDFGADTINTANFKGDAFDYPGGGPALAIKTVEHNIGVDIDYYARLDFTAFETLVDAIGGIEIDNPADINDQEYPDGNYGYDPFVLAAGKHTLNGYDALRYARTRHDSSDVDRAKRQQQVVLAVRDKVLSLNMLPQLALQAPTLYTTLNQSIQTDLSLQQIIELALLAQDIPRDRIKNGVIDYQYVLEYSFTTNEGLVRQVLVPLRDKIRELRDELFAASAALASPLQVNLEAARAEDARVQVLNGSGKPGLAGTTSEWLRAQGLNVLNPGNADRADYTNAVVIDYTGKPNTAQWLAQMFGAGSVVSGANPAGGVDVQVIVGGNWEVPGGP